jgi:hypothetical protein
LHPHSRCAEALLHHLVGDQEDGHTDQHPDAELPALEHVFGLHDEVEGDRRDQRAGAEAGQNADEAGGHVEPAGKEACEQQGRRAEQAQAECLKHPSPLEGTPDSRRWPSARRCVFCTFDLEREAVDRDDAHA